MIKFIEGEYDVLVATTIIEAGLDIPNANTIIINNANMFGLSDLHQMRGRVGRSNKKAFCYLLVPGIISLTNDARRRLQAIEEFSDLDIRGAGNLLGGEQSGFIAEIGFEMYHKILDEAIHELKDDEFAELFQNEDKSYKLEARDCNLETDFEALIPDKYIRNSAERLAIYNQLALLKTEANIQEFKAGLIDRFGKSPKQVEDLLDLIRVRELGKKIGFERMILKSNKMSAYFPNEQNQTYFQSDKFAQIIQYVQKHSNKMNLKQSGSFLLLQMQPIHTIQQSLHELNLLFVQLNQTVIS
jgi:transcription-repair coupling factor (superfamily II helicase)